jgi:hypothetical protein
MWPVFGGEVPPGFASGRATAMPVGDSDRLNAWQIERGLQLRLSFLGPGAESMGAIIEPQVILLPVVLGWLITLNIELVLYNHLPIDKDLDVNGINIEALVADEQSNIGVRV